MTVRAYLETVSGVYANTTIVITPGITPTCDWCGHSWPTGRRGQLPGGYRITGYGDTQRIHLYCSPDCADQDQERS